MTALRWSEAVWIELPWTDGESALGWMLGPTPTFKFKQAPEGLVTRRQLRDAGLCPGGQDPWAQLLWRVYSGRPQWAGLYRLDLATQKRVPSAAQLAAVTKATTARLAQLVCPDCGEYAGFRVIPEAGRIHCDPQGWAVAA